MSSVKLFQFVDVERKLPDKKPLEQRKIEFVEVYDQPYLSKKSDEHIQKQSARCLDCGNPYCEWKCPVHNYIPQWLKLAEQGKFIEAAELCHVTNTLPEVCGRICPQDRLCEGACTLNDGFGAVTIGNVEKYITEKAFALGWRPTVDCDTFLDHKIAIIGAGPAGLSCADVLVRNGVVKPVVFDKYPEIGGLCTYGIPPFKLEKSIMLMRHEIFTDMGIEFSLGVEIGKDIMLEQLLQDYDAVFLGMGAYKYRHGNLANLDAKGVYEALPYLIGNMNTLDVVAKTDHEPVDLKGQSVLILGGGDTAMDCVRTAIRQQAKPVMCGYRRDEKNMPGSPHEVGNSRVEGVEFMWNAQPLEILVDEQNQVTGVKFIRTELSAPNRKGKQSAANIPGSEFIMKVDAVIIAFGFEPSPPEWVLNQGVTVDDGNRVLAPENQAFPYQTTNPKIFAGGDMVLGADLVVRAIDQGRRAAMGILDYLSQ